MEKFKDKKIAAEEMADSRKTEGPGSGLSRFHRDRVCWQSKKLKNIAQAQRVNVGRWCPRRIS